MPPDTMSDTPDGVLPEAFETHPQGVRVTIEVAGLREVWEYPFVTSALKSALAAIEAVHMELQARQEMAQQLEREFSDGEVDPEYRESGTGEEE